MIGNMYHLHTALTSFEQLLAVIVSSILPIKLGQEAEGVFACKPSR